jgi:beta-glucuronidase
VTAAVTTTALLCASPALGADIPRQGSVYKDGPSGRYLLDGAWYTRPDPPGAGIGAHYERQAGLAGWSPTTVPNAANAGDFSKTSYLGEVQWYRKDFLTPSAAGGSRWILRFESVNYRSTVWLNGRKLGEHAGAYVPFELAAPKLRPGRPNRLVIRVDSRRTRLDVPPLAVRSDGRFVGGWWNYNGILREVYLRRVRHLDLRELLVRPRIACRSCPANVDVTAVIANVTRTARPATVEGQMGGQRFVLRAANVPAGGGRYLRTRFTIPHPRLWSPQQPSLYLVRFRVRDADGATVQRYTVRTGVRSFSVSPSGQFLINFRPASLRGASMHEDDPLTGAALRPDQLEANMRLLRELGANMTRSHYPMHPLTLELADRFGIVVWSEIPVYQMQERLFLNRQVRRRSLAMLRRTILRDRNHPSVAVWSLGNENTSQPGTGFDRYVREGERLARRLDPTRLVALAIPGYPTAGRQKLYASLDALGINDYFGWYDGPDGSLGSRQGLGPYLDQVRGQYPRQALFVTEFGAEANRAGPVGEKGTYDFQSDLLAYHLRVYASKPFIAGALVWILRDFPVKPGFDGGNPQPTPPFNMKGLVAEDGTRKPAFDVVRRLLHEGSPGP